MKIQHIQLSLYIFSLSFIVLFLGCQDSTSVIDPNKKDSEVVLRDYTLSEDEKWEPVKTYIVHGTLDVPPNIVLEVIPGTVVKFNRNALLKVRGTLKIGTPLSEVGLEELVQLTSDGNNPESGDWKGILFDHTHDIDSFVRGTVVEYAIIALDIKTASPAVIDCTLRNNDTAVALDGSNSKIQYNAIHNNRIGISTIERQNRPRIESNNITNNDVGILCENVQSIIEFNNFEDNNYALRLNVKFHLGVPNNWWGTVVNEEIDRIILDAKDTDIITKPLGTVTYEPIATISFTDTGPRE